MVSNLEVLKSAVIIVLTCYLLFSVILLVKARKAIDVMLDYAVDELGMEDCKSLYLLGIFFCGPIVFKGLIKGILFGNKLDGINSVDDFKAILEKR